MADLKTFQKELTAEHDKLSKAYAAAHTEAEAKWAVYEQAKAALLAFRGTYGKVLKALNDGAVKVEG